MGSRARSVSWVALGVGDGVLGGDTGVDVAGGGTGVGVVEQEPATQPREA